MISSLSCRKSEKCDVISASDDSTLVCLKRRCRNGDVDCLLNTTDVIQYLHLALPALTSLRQPVRLVTMQPKHAVTQYQDFTVVSPEVASYFAIERDAELPNTGE